MAVFKCKMCGGDLMVNEGSSVCECEYCGSMQTVPNIDDEKKMTLFNRANRLRINGEFDKAAGVYESIVAEFSEEAEAYWGLVLCKYGIEYVDDPVTAKKIPTCHRSSFDSVMDDKDFEMVMEYSDPVSRRVYREEAKQFENIRRGIIEISGKEEPYDIFICYKETDENGGRTLDSVLAQDIYDALTGKGYRVFFARVTLEDKLGQEYEPYIFAALHSAKIMLAIGTDYEYYNAVWVKNEWSRYLKLIAAGEKKTLIPCYKGLDAYDMPKEFARLQAQDLGKVGAIQDLMRGIEKIIGSKKDNRLAQDRSNAGANPSVDSYLKRIQIFLEDREWGNAATYCEKVLDIDPENGKAYVAALLASLHASSIEQLASKEEPLEKSTAYNKALRFANDDDKKRIEEANQIVKARIAEKEEADRIAAKNAAEAKKAADMARIKNMKRARIILGIEPDPEIAKKINDEDKRYVEEIRRLEAELASERNNEAQLLQAAEREKEEMCASEDARFNEHITLLENKEKELKQESAKLGLFAGTRKREINAELESLSKKISNAREEHKNNLSAIEEGAAAKCQEIGKNSALITSKIEEEGKKHNKLKSELKRSFGRYPITMNGDPKPIEWEILDATDSAALIVSKYALDYQKYNAVKKSASWEYCDLRRWLNAAFWHKAFNEEEKARIINSAITTGRDEVMDNVFILSKREVGKYFDSNERRRCKATEYVCDLGAYHDEEKCCQYWLRSSFDKADYIHPNGCESYRGKDVKELSAVRPAMWISLEE